MIYLLIATGIALAVLVAVLVIRPMHDDDISTNIRDIKQVEDERRRRLIALNEAYTLAKSELGEEPTIEQILLTRDSLQIVKELNGTS